MTLNLDAIVTWIIVGLAAGWLASTIRGEKRGLLGYLGVGLVGSVIGGLLFSLLEIGGATNILGSVLVATVGAVIVLAIVK